MTILPTTSQGSKHSHLLDSLTNHDKSDLQSTTLHSVTHLVLDWTGKIQFTPNQTLSRWSITLAFSNLEDQTCTRWVKLGISQLHSTFMTHLVYIEFLVYQVAFASKLYSLQNHATSAQSHPHSHLQQKLSQLTFIRNLLRPELTAGMNTELHASCRIAEYNRFPFRDLLDELRTVASMKVILTEFIPQV